jgi:hypothetical protein
MQDMWGELFLDWGRMSQVEFKKEATGRRIPMKRQRHKLIAMILVIGIAGAMTVMALDSYYAATATSLDEGLSILPTDCQFVLGFNMQQFVSSPAYERLKEKQIQQNSRELEQEFIEKTGVDPERDISYILAAARSIDLPGSGDSLEKTEGKGVIAIIGNFNPGAITAFIQSKINPGAAVYEGMSIMLMPERNPDADEKGMVFLNDREIVMGDLDSLKAVIDVRTRGEASILFNPHMASLIDSVPSDEMLWFAGDTRRVAEHAPLNTPLGENIGTVQNIVGTLSITDFVAGRITLTAVDAESAVRLADMGRGFVAFAQLAGDKNPDLKMLVSGLSVLQDSTQVSLVMNFPTYLLERLDNLKKQPVQ